jgi:opacity protein-like surface antigen
MKYLISIILITPLIGNAAENFVGPYVGFSFDTRMTTTQVNGWTNDVFGAGKSGMLNGSAGTQLVPKIDVGYSLVLAPRARLEVGVNYDPLKSSVLQDPSNAFLTGTSDLKSKNGLTFYAKPGLLIYEETLAYVKVGYSQFKLVDPNPTQSIQSQTYQGLDFGFGIKTKIDDKLSLYTEIESITYQNKKDYVVNASSSNAVISTVKPMSLSASVGISYQF